MPRLINVLGGPCVGKSTIAAGLHYQLSIRGYVVELVPEYAKKLIWSGNTAMLDDQYYVSSMQYRALHDLCQQQTIDYVITDGPLLHGLYYNIHNPNNVSNREVTQAKILEYYAEFENINVYLRRSSRPYDITGRVHTEDEARHCDAKLLEIFHEYRIPYRVFGSDDSTLRDIVEWVTSVTSGQRVTRAPTEDVDDVGSGGLA